MLKKAESIGAILERLIKSLGIEKRLKEESLFGLWDEEAGSKIAANATPAYIKRGRLTVFVRSGAHIQEYSFLKERLKDKLNARLGKKIIREIVFIVGEVKRQTENCRPFGDPPLRREN